MSRFRGSDTLWLTYCTTIFACGHGEHVNLDQLFSLLQLRLGIHVPEVSPTRFIYLPSCRILWINTTWSTIWFTISSKIVCWRIFREISWIHVLPDAVGAREAISPRQRAPRVHVKILVHSRWTKNIPLLLCSYLETGGEGQRFCGQSSFAC